jgi:hypothetical protein
MKNELIKKGIKKYLHIAVKKLKNILSLLINYLLILKQKSTKRIKYLIIFWKNRNKIRYWVTFLRKFIKKHPRFFKFFIRLK